MKRKYQGIVSVIILLLLPVLVGVYYKSGIWRKTLLPTGKPVSPLTSGSWMPTDEQIKSIDELLPDLAVLSTPSPRDSKPAPLFILGQRSYGGAGTKAQDDSDDDKIAYTLSMTLLAGPIRYCIVDGDFVTEGARLADGAAVMRIDKQRVLISKNRKRQWIHLDDASIEPGQMKNKAGSIHSNAREDNS